MKMILVLGWGLGLMASSSADAAVPQVFQHVVEPLSIVLEADFGLINTRGQTAAEIGRTGLGSGMIDSVYFESAGKMTYQTHTGETGSFSVKIQPKGMSRRQRCVQKPLRITFDSKPKSGEFAGIAKEVETVPHCVPSVNLPQLHHEYFAYRVLDSFGLPAYRLRKVTFTYRDTSGRLPEVTNVGFLIEPEKNFEARSNLEIMDPDPAWDAIPFSQDELAAVSGYGGWGESYIPKMARKARVYREYVRLKPLQVMKLQDFVRVKLISVLVRHDDLNVSALDNIFAVQFPNGSVNLVPYDYDRSSFLMSFNPMSTIPMVMQAFCQDQLKMDLKSCLAVPGYDAKSIQQVFVDTFRKMISSYEVSFFDEEMKLYSADPSYTEAVMLRKKAAEMLMGLQAVIVNPEPYFRF